MMRQALRPAKRQAMFMPRRSSARGPMLALEIVRMRQRLMTMEIIPTLRLVEVLLVVDLMPIHIHFVMLAVMRRRQRGPVAHRGSLPDVRRDVHVRRSLEVGLFRVAMVALGHFLEGVPGRDGAEGALHVRVDDLQAVDVGGVDPAEAIIHSTQSAN